MMIVEQILRQERLQVTLVLNQIGWVLFCFFIVLKSKLISLGKTLWVKLELLNYHQKFGTIGLSKHNMSKLLHFTLFLLSLSKS